MGEQTQSPRSRVCLQCKRRKVKCDGIRPQCGSCMRSQANISRLADKHGGQLSTTGCRYEDQHVSEGMREPGVCSETSSGRNSSGINIPSVITGLESTSDTPHLSSHRSSNTNSFTTWNRSESTSTSLGITNDVMEDRGACSSDMEMLWSFDWSNTASNLESPVEASSSYASGTLDPLTAPGPFSWESNRALNPNPEPNAVPSAPAQWSCSTEYGRAESGQAGCENMTAFGNSMSMDNTVPIWSMIPLKWPENLPGPVLLEYLIQIWFARVPQYPRMISEQALIARIRLPPENPNFPQASLLHAICASASAFTGLVDSMAPMELPFALHRQTTSGYDLSSIADFGLAQAESSQMAIRTADQTCLFAPSEATFEVLQASLILADYYYLNGFALQSLVMSAVPGRLCKALRMVEPILYAPMAEGQVTNSGRLKVAWVTFVADAVFSLCNYWSSSLPLEDMGCPLPDTLLPGDEYRQIVWSPDLYTRHLSNESFVLVVKGAILLARTGNCLRDDGKGNDRTIIENINAISQDCHLFYDNLPNMYKNMECGSDMGSLANRDTMMIHISPLLALLMLSEHAHVLQQPTEMGDINTVSSESDAAYNAIMGLLHMVPSNFDPALLLDSMLAFCIYTAGRLIVVFAERMTRAQRFVVANRYRSDLAFIQGILKQYGRRFAVGEIMAKALGHHLQLADERATATSCQASASAGLPVRRFSRHDFFPCVYNDPFVVRPEF